MDTKLPKKIIYLIFIRVRVRVGVRVRVAIAIDHTFTVHLQNRDQGLLINKLAGEDVFMTNFPMVKSAI